MWIGLTKRTVVAILNIDIFVYEKVANMVRTEIKMGDDVNHGKTGKNESGLFSPYDTYRQDARYSGGPLGE